MAEKFKPKIGGRAYSNGIRLQDDKRTVKVYYDKDNNLQYEISQLKRNKYMKTIKKIPVIRGIVGLLYALLMFLKESVNKPRKYWFIFLIILADFIYIFASGGDNSTVNSVVTGLYFLIPMILLLIFRKKVVEVLKYHGAEHKVVHYYENDCMGEINSYSRLHRRCGSNIVFYYLLISLGAGFLLNIRFNGLLMEFVFLGLAYEAIKYTPEKLLFIPQLFQRVVTGEPDEKHIKAAARALEILTGKY